MVTVRPPQRETGPTTQLRHKDTAVCSGSYGLNGVSFHDLGLGPADSESDGHVLFGGAGRRLSPSFSMEWAHQDSNLGPTDYEGLE
jgi:hypothetical protein